MPVLNRYKDQLPPDAVYIGRGSPWGNPFVIGRDGTREEVVEQHKRKLWDDIRNKSISLADLAQLHEKPLVCFCAPLACHGHTLERAAAWANQQLMTQKTPAETPNVIDSTDSETPPTPTNPTSIPKNSDPEEATPAWTFHADGTLPTHAKSVFVFGSNVSGRHGLGAARLAAEQFGARYGQGRGLSGRSYAIPTKEDGPAIARTGKPSLVTRSLQDIAHDVDDFVAFARENPSMSFFVTRIGCQLAGYKDEEIAPLFAAAPANCSFAREWEPFLRMGCAPAHKHGCNP